MFDRPVCTVEGCDNAAYARDLCESHYKRWWRTGSVTPKRRPSFDEVARAGKADAVVALLAAKQIVVHARPEDLARAVGIGMADLRAAIERKKRAPRQRPEPKRRGPNRKAPKGTKWCNRCQRHRLLERFGPNRHNRDGLAGWCRDCQRDYNRSWQAARKARRGSTAL